MRNSAIVLLPLAVLLAVAGCASLLAYGILQAAGDILPLHKLVSKVTLVLLLISVFPLRNWLTLSWADLGFVAARQFFSQIGQGLLLGVASLLPVLLVLYALDVQVWDQSRVWSVGKIAEKVGLALFFSVLIGVGEELLFRGLLLSSLRRRLPLLMAVVVSAVYYAALHFLKSTSQIAYTDLQWYSGWQLMTEAFANWLNPQIGSAFVALFVVGLFLAVLRLYRPQSLGLCIGCHAGWVWQIKVCKDLFNVNPQAQSLYLVSSYDGVIGPLVSVWLLLAIGLWLARQHFRG